MNTRLSLLCTSALLALTACGSDGSKDDQDQASSFEFVVWPENGSTVFADGAIYVGDPAAEGSIDGSIAVVVGGEALAAGAAVPADALRFEAGKTFGYVTLPVGEQTLHVHHFDADGKATDQHQTVKYTVEATPADLGVAWLEPTDGATVKSPFKVRFGMTGAGMSPAGENALDKTVGHHHITIDKGVITPGVILPMGADGFLHYGKAQTEAEVTLPAGEYELTMQFADAAHRSYGKAMAKTIKVTVE
ncbi:MAG: DUF4399 domain-containing protein [Planctomycetes bacterium]|nr:DUF4399 domain-containing protein [Planctomycetota bacterium]